MSKVNKTRYALLGVLSLAPASGYDIKKLCDFSISHFWNENYAHIYPVLKELEKEGMVIKAEEQAEGRPPKNVYSITGKGREELEKWLLTAVEEGPKRNELLLKMFFSTPAHFESIIERIGQEKEKHQRLIEEFGKIETELKSNETTKDKEALTLWLSIISFGRYDSEARIKWCEETINTLKKQLK